MAQWDGIAGSRWATEFASVVQHPNNRPRRDGHSVVYLQQDCPPGNRGGASWNMPPGPGRIDLRYGNAALYNTQIDIAVCATVETTEQMQGVLAHEVGHAMGMAHLCEPGEVCWSAADHEHDQDHRCRPMYHLFGPCRSGLTELDHDAARHLYPTLQRLWGPDVDDTAARASYATIWSQTADVVILARWGAGLAWPLLAAEEQLELIQQWSQIPFLQETAERIARERTTADERDIRQMVREFNAHQDLRLMGYYGLPLSRPYNYW
jgi:hypothetical protein